MLNKFSNSTSQNSTTSNISSTQEHSKAGVRLKQLTVAISASLALSLSYAAETNEAEQVAQDTQAQSAEATGQQGSVQQDNTQQVSSAQTTDNQVEEEGEEEGEAAAESTQTKAQTQTKSQSSSELSAMAQQVNNSEWQPGVKMTQAVGTKVQALLNWNHHGVGAVDGWWGKNTQKAMQAFQKAKGLPVTDTLDQKTWKALQSGDLASKPVLISYTLTDSDVNIKTTTIPQGVEAKSKLEGLYYESVAEAMAEKFHMSIGYLKQLNPNATFTEGETLTVYNPSKANKKVVTRVVADKNSQTLYAYDKNDKLVASYPTTVGSTATPSPIGTHKVQTKVSDPNYTHTDAEGKQTILPPGPNNPVGRVWIGLTKPSYGIHGSPDPERISRQASAGCIRLTNWDAMALLNTIDNNATVEIK
ncbi:Putative L,D-transpeptidase YkuD [Psychrobacter pasteurii]|uniref:Putative L,D-transpeptidase YkuD n=1 Tax=Psychrobacter pasteurii TaxID=1945520 RepID=A0A1R4EH40_9GAMM|nr:L,D-transpeptidase family protein [Psychrobacter pasteurii]SJM37798.1 Putative L,D-transpeptidase YkuD [Psychrobacter pasteurii]